MRSVSRFVYYWIPPLVWMAMIYYMSSQPRIGMTESTLWDFVIFKTLHMIEYGLLFFLLYRALLSLPKWNDMWSFAVGMIISIGYAVSDELHQLTIASRQGKLRDVIIDIIGMLIVYAMIKSIRAVRKLL